ncbi:hypothetical protein D9758_004208 [Tetrapyrgos nigripes]|uniref:Zn(2)-C6 fungal-type domain-containing protein n=1 Tax=Tetrapyrgos nigripes TaxID=182062 RepID=A0A8H5GU02_9AGAR|nr:hypothetical protein D9758_004208 [Tetrapyrgos nigripes]
MDPQIPASIPNTAPTGPQTKRKRISLACHRCRQKKAKCNGSKPVCSNCESAGESCDWPDPEQDGRRNKARKTDGVRVKESGHSSDGPIGHRRASSDTSLYPYEDMPHSISPDADVYDRHRGEFGAGHHSNGVNSSGSRYGSLPAMRHSSGSRSTVPKFNDGLDYPPAGNGHYSPIHPPSSSSIPNHPPSSSTGMHLPNQSPLDVLLAAALPMDPDSRWNSSTRAQPTPSAVAVPASKMEAIETLRVPPPEPPLVLQYHRPFGPTAIQPGLEQISIAFRAPYPGSRCPSPTPFESSPQLSEPSLKDHTTSFSFEPLHYTNGEVLNHHPSIAPIASGSGHQPLLSSPSIPIFPPQIDSPYDPGSDIPRPLWLNKLLPLFFMRMGSHFPFLTEASLLANIDHDDPSKRVTAPLLINTVCALAARFSDTPILRSQVRDQSPATYGIPFAEKAKQLLIPMLGYPSSNTVASLLFLAYFSFGLNSEGALWTYSGMALRMAVDLGLHQDITSRTAAGDLVQRTADRLLWWSSFVLDRTLAFGTGRPVTIKDNEIKASLPTEEEILMIIHTDSLTNPADLHIQRDQSGQERTPSPFPHHVKMFQLYGALAEYINSVDSTWRPPGSEPPSRADGENGSVPVSGSNTGSTNLAEVEDLITTAYHALPDVMVFNSENLRMHTAIANGPVFLALHLWYNSIIILLYRPPLIHPRVNASRTSLQDRLAVVNNSCLAISNILSGADLVDQFAYLASPFVNQCFFIAATAWVQEYRIRTGRDVLASSSSTSGATEHLGPSVLPSTGNNTSSTTNKILHSSTNLLAQTSMNNFRMCKKALSRQAAYWMGVKWIEAVVEKYASQKRRTSLKNATEGVATFVSGAEMAIFKRLVQRTTGESPSSDISPENLTSLIAAFTSQASMQGQDQSGLRFSEDDWALAYSFASFANNSCPPTFS